MNASVVPFAGLDATEALRLEREDFLAWGALMAMLVLPRAVGTVALGAVGTGNSHDDDMVTAL